MPYSRRQTYLRPVKTEKHEGTWSFLLQNASATQEIIIARATAGEPVLATDVEVGSQIKSVYFEFNLNGVDNSGTAQVFHWMIYKNPIGNFAPLDPLSYDTASKSRIMKRGMEMLPEIPLGSGGTVQTKRIFVVKIPRVYHRMAENDEINLTYRSTSSSNINFCGIFIFKEFK